MIKLLRSFFDGSRPSFARFFQTAFVTYAGMGLSLVSAPILARTLGPDGRGVLAAAFVATQVLSWVAFLGLPRGLSVQEHRRSSVSGWGVVVIGVLGPASAALALAGSETLSNGDERIALGIRIGATVLILTGLSQLGLEYVLIKGQMWRFNLARIANVVLPSVGYIVAFVLGHLTLEVAFSITFLASVVATLLGCIYAIPALRRARRVPIPWNFSLRYWTTSAFDSVGGRLDQLILTSLSPASVLGVYTVAVTCASASGGLTQALNHVTYSKFAGANASLHANTSVLRRRTLIGGAMSIAVAVPVLLIVIFYGTSLFGPGYEGLPLVTAILIVSQFLNDQWQLRIYLDSASEDARSLTLSSGMGLVALASAAALFNAAGTLTGAHMAICVVLFGAVRLGSRTILRRYRPANSKRL
ncbi:oligosaccharide flippase family protein [Agreia sp. VKM Ac-1783]|uniref:oligosaccharide flippase family protein n=1 Tax=Agreia sp. VKM Ac-1783 TaxID=1938889 RepID=UPI000A2ACCA8|nr:Membrane protein involved in the export of O-antigen and teichoic acid [Agreia sp. VKM Ac-1783]